MTTENVARFWRLKKSAIPRYNYDVFVAGHLAGRIREEFGFSRSASWNAYNLNEKRLYSSDWTRDHAALAVANYYLATHPDVEVERPPACHGYRCFNPSVKAFNDKAYCERHFKEVRQRHEISAARERGARRRLAAAELDHAVWEWIEQMAIDGYPQAMLLMKQRDELREVS